MRSHFITRILMLIIMAISVIASPAIAQESATIYTDGDGRFQIPIPVGWENLSTEAQAHFVSPDGEVNIYAFEVEADDVSDGLAMALETLSLAEGLDPIQVVDVPISASVTWTQQVYQLSDSRIVAALGRVDAGITYTIILDAPLALSPDQQEQINLIVIEHQLLGKDSASTDNASYVDPSAFTEQEIVFMSDEFQINGSLTMPTTDEPVPAVILVHGSGPSDQDATIGLNKPFRDLAHGLSSQGIAVLRYEKRTLTYGNEFGSTVDDETTNDAIAAVEYLRNFDRIDPDRIFVLGHSQGGAFAPRIAEQSGDVSGIIIMAGFARPFEELLAEQIAYLQTVNPDADYSGLEATIELISSVRADSFVADTPELEAAEVYWRSFTDYDPLVTVLNLEIPILVLQGERDYQVTIQDFELWQTTLTNYDSATFISYPDLNHIMMDQGDLDRVAVPDDYIEPDFVDEDVINDIVEWVLSAE